MELGDTLRNLRKKQNMSLSALAEKTETTSSHLSQIERNTSSPSITLLKKIAKALDVPITYFFEEPKGGGRVVRKKERKKLTIPDSNFVYEIISPPNIDFQMLMTKIEVGGDLGEQPIGHAGDECNYVMQGEVQMTVDGETFRLSEGDSIYYPAQTPHHVINTGDVEAIIISVINPASF